MKKRLPVIVVIGVIKKGEKYLLTKRQSPKNEWNKWQFPGGGLEFGEKLEEAIKREINEELGVKVKVEKIIFPIIEIIRKNDNFHGVFFVFLCQMINKKDPIKINFEASEYGWFTKEEIKKLDSLLGTQEIIDAIENSSDKSEAFFQMPLCLTDS